VTSHVWSTPRVCGRKDHVDAVEGGGRGGSIAEHKKSRQTQRDLTTTVRTETEGAALAFGSLVFFAV